jgi:hypothetical protein
LSPNNKLQVAQKPNIKTPLHIEQYRKKTLL